MAVCMKERRASRKRLLLLLLSAIREDRGMVNRGGVKVGDGVSVWQIYDQRPASVSERGGGAKRGRKGQR